tara:strand:+ start:347 stop:727 length:381 start_codon:yes stop_codon:yes gene_type:complete
MYKKNIEEGDLIEVAYKTGPVFAKVVGVHPTQHKLDVYFIEFDKYVQSNEVSMWKYSNQISTIESASVITHIRPKNKDYVSAWNRLCRMKMHDDENTTFFIKRLVYFSDSDFFGSSDCETDTDSDY